MKNIEKIRSQLNDAMNHTWLEVDYEKFLIELNCLLKLNKAEQRLEFKRLLYYRFKLFVKAWGQDADFEKFINDNKQIINDVNIRIKKMEEILDTYELNTEQLQILHGLFISMYHIFAELVLDFEFNKDIPISEIMSYAELDNRNIYIDRLNNTFENIDNFKRKKSD